MIGEGGQNPRNSTLILSRIYNFKIFAQAAKKPKQKNAKKGKKFMKEESW